MQDLPNSKPKAFYDLNDYPEYKHLASHYTTILKELQESNFWLKWGGDDYDPLGHCQFLAGDWSICPIYFGKTKPTQIDNPAVNRLFADIFIQNLPYQFPETIKLLKSIKNINFSAFSRLHKRSVLSPHTHRNPTSLIFHLGLIVPPENSSGLKVADEVHLWKKPGDAIIFDDKIIHSAWNDSDQDRILFYTEFTK